jgi:hypothetical protein
MQADDLTQHEAVLAKAVHTRSLAGIRAVVQNAILSLAISRANYIDPRIVYAFLRTVRAASRARVRQRGVAQTLCLGKGGGAPFGSPSRLMGGGVVEG